ncbi:Zn finger protein HypA/HybF involved in hydrogenase expression [Evansella vedderi]|uniref:Zn finger protein HypA/HybF involved in hydrogenase expression n=1 Tax=Evansella vedderi TaxID=38282 RepID=A0ABU0A1P7_9BACI|nr:hypothetical protein [Evansella vedderi]MDQ0257400.1 Zn finger protein HypA/HybF involved in hydrogenase expression [Evansella vedderi]
MPTWLIVVLVVAVLAIIVVLVKTKGSSSALNEEDNKVTCKSCNAVIPDNYTKSLCPECKAFLT